MRHLCGRSGAVRLKRPDLFTITQNSYACGLPRHWKETRELVDYIQYLEHKLQVATKENTDEHRQK